MRSRRSANLSLNAANRRCKRKSKRKPIGQFQLQEELYIIKKPIVKKFSTPISVGKKRRGPRSPIFSLTSPRKFSPFKRTSSGTPAAKKMRKSLASEFGVVNKNTQDENGNEFTFIQEIRIESTTENDINDLWENVFDILKEKGFDQVLLNFLRLIGDGKFPLDNLALALFADVVNWYSCRRTTEMRYSRESKIFWKLGYRLFGGRFLHFMGGNKNQGDIVLESGEKGNLNPATSDINFAVPNENTLRQFDQYCLNAQCSNSFSPGILKDMIDTLGKNLVGTSCCLTFDGKKLKQGLTPTCGDVDLFGFEPELSIDAKRQKLNDATRPFHVLKDKIIASEVEDLSFLKITEKESLKNEMTAAIKLLSLDILEVKDVRKKKEYAKQKLIERCGETDWKNSRFVMAISCMIAYIHDIDEYISMTREVLQEIVLCIACLNGTAEHVVNGSKANLYKLQNYCGLETDECVDTRQIKQRTEIWHGRRNTAKVTGSTIFGAIGFDGVKRQQDYFDNLICGCAKTYSEKVLGFMKYGTEKEPSAMATLTSKVVPVLFPKKMFCEEGFVEIGNTTENAPFMIVSPDGSIRSDKTIGSTEQAVELKCPVMDIHRSLPARYFLQCQAEINALGVDRLVYLCWKPDFSSVFIVHRDETLFSTAYSIAERLYKTESPTRMRSLKPEVKQLKQDIDLSCKNENIVTFVGLFPSVDHDINFENRYETNIFKIARVELILSQIIKVIENKYELLREKATEAVVFLCSTMDRNLSSKSVTAPVCWFTKGYSLDSNTMRRIAEHVLDICKKADIHIPAISFDGQWHVLAVRDENNEPLTKLQLQKDVWREAESTKKQDILAELQNLNKDPEWIIRKNPEGEILGYMVYSKSTSHLPKVSQRVFKQRILDEKRKKRNTNSGINEAGYSAQNRTENEICDLIDAETYHEGRLNNLNEQTETQTQDGGEEVMQPDGSRMNDENEVVSFEECQKSTESDRRNVIKMAAAAVNIDLEQAVILLNMLKTDQNSNKKGKWDNSNACEIKDNMHSKDKLKNMREVDLKVIVRYLKKKGHRNMKESDNKANKFRKICEVLGMQLDVDEQVTVKQSSRAKKKTENVVKSLKNIAFHEVSKLKKMDLNIVYAEYIWPDRLLAWQQKAFKTKTKLYGDHERVQINSDDQTRHGDEIISGASKHSTELDGNSRMDRKTEEATDANCSADDKRTDFTEFFYVPSYSSRRQQYEVSCIDSSHLLTRTRRKCCKGGLDGCSNIAWHNVAKAGKTNLSVAMTECIIDPMSVPTAVTHFSESVEKEMIRNGDYREARLCRDIREWWMSEDNSGISARNRIRMRMALRKRLLEHVEFGHFPPPGMYVKGWPNQLWEGLLANIDAKTLLYALSKQNSYNTRAFSSLVGETFFSELTMYDRRGQGTVTTAEFQSFMGTAVEKLHMRLDSERQFVYKTSRKTVYRLLNETDFSKEVDQSSCDEQHDIPVTNHLFDTQECTRVKGRKKEESVSASRNAVQRGSLGVRWEKARRNDSKILPTMRMGLDI